MRRLWPLLLLAYCALIYYLSDQPMLPVPMLFNMQDKLMHACAYAVMAGLCWMSFCHRFSLPVLRAIVPLFCLCYGISDEWHQSFIPGRDASIGDVAADLTGAFLLTAALWNSEFKQT